MCHLPEVPPCVDATEIFFKSESFLFLDKLVSVTSQKEPAKDINYSRLLSPCPVQDKADNK